MKLWLGIQIFIVLGYFALTFLFWGNIAILFLSMAIVPLFIFIRMEHLAMVSGLAVRNDFKVVSIFTLWLGVLLVVFPYLLTEIYWHTKELFFQLGRGNLFWEFGRIAFVVTGVSLAWGVSVVPWTSLKNRHKGVVTLTSSFNSVVLGSNLPKRPMKLTIIVILAMTLTVGLGIGMGALLVWFGGYSMAAIFYEPTLVVQRLIMIGGLLLGLFPICFMTSLWWRKAQLVSALESDTLVSL